MGARGRRHSAFNRELRARVSPTTARGAESDSGRWRRLQRRARSTNRYAGAEIGIAQFPYQHYRSFRARPRGRAREYIRWLDITMRAQARGARSQRWMATVQTPSATATAAHVARRPMHAVN